MTDPHFAAILEGLADPAAYPQHPAEVSIIETHISAVFLAGARAYKVKKPLTLPFLDFGTLAAREHFCREEVRLNADLARGVYRDVVPIRRHQDRLRIGGSVPHHHLANERGSAGGDLVDWAVEMERLPAHAMLDELLVRGHLDNDMLRQIAETLVRFHARAATGDGVDEHGDLAAVRTLVEENFAETDHFLRARSLHVLERGVHDFVEAWALHFLHERRELFAQRVAQARVREGHGDLHAGNICFRPEGLTIYDRIEFGARFRCGDVAADLAFLLMDLDHRGYRGFSDYLLREYVARSEDTGLLELVDFYKCYRAFVRGKVTALRAEQSRGDAREAARLLASRYFNLAAGYALPPCLVLMCGLPGTGKSRASGDLTAAFDSVAVNSDTTRKQQAGVPPGEHRPAAFATGLYDAAHTQATYAAMLAAAEQVLGKGRSVVVDAGFRHAAQRAPFLALAQEHCIPVVVVYLDPPDAVVRERLLARQRSGAGESDAGVAVYERCKQGFEPPHASEGASVVTSHASDAGPELVGRVLGALLAQAEASADPGVA